MNLLLNKPKKSEWKEIRNCTYFTAVEKPESQTYVMGFTLHVVQGVTATKTAEGGWLCELRHVNYPPNKIFSCFITSSGIQSQTRFHSDIAKTPGMPMVVTPKLDTKLLGAYVAWKNSEYAKMCKAKNQKLDKMPVENRNLQEDGKTYCFGPSLFFIKENDVVVRCDTETSDYVWIPGRMKNIQPLEIYEGPDNSDVLEIIRAKLEADSMGDTFIQFLLICGHTTILSLHYKEMLKIFSHVPAMVVTGPRHTGKSLSTEISACYIGVNGIKICVAKDITLSAMRARYTSDQMPFVAHDVMDITTIVSGLQESFEGRDVKNRDEISTPGTSVAFTCNEKPMLHLQSKLEAVSRAVVIPMMTEMAPMTLMESTDVKSAMQCASRHFPALLNITEEDKVDIRNRAYGLREKVSKAMPELTECHGRIPENYGMLIAATELFLNKTNHQGWTLKVESFVLNKLLPCIAPFYMGPASSRPIASTIQDKAVVENVIEEFCNIIGKLDADKLTQCFFVRPTVPFVSIRREKFDDLVKQSNLSFATASIVCLPGVVKSDTAKFLGSSHRAVSIPTTYFTDTQLAALKMTQSQGTSVHTEPAGMSPFKHLGASPIPSAPPWRETALQAPPSPEVAKPRTSRISQDRASSPELSVDHADSSSLPAHEGSFTVNSQVDLPSDKNSSSSGHSAGTGTKRNNTNDCAGCGERKSPDGSDKTYKCNGCAKRFHMACQDADPKNWPSGVHSRRRCIECRVDDALTRE